MKYAKPSGRLLADVGEERKKSLYKILVNKDLNFKEWLIKTIDKYIKKESEVKE